MCACGDPSRKGIDHTQHVCATAGFFNPADFAAIDAAANREDSTDEPPRHAR